MLESAGLVRRDDHQRDRLWVLGVQESSRFPDEAELEESLKQANPKGRLLEFCTRMRLEPPKSDIYPEGAFHVATMSIVFQGTQLDSGPCHAASKKTAEQLAAQSLLGLIAARDLADQARHVSTEDSIRLQASNPKDDCSNGALNIKSPHPISSKAASTAGYRVRASLALTNGEQVVSTWFDAAKLKVGEQAAAETLLQETVQSAYGRPGTPHRGTQHRGTPRRGTPRRGIPRRGGAHHANLVTIAGGRS